MPEQPEASPLLTTVLRPLLEDFQHWFQRSIDLLESESISFLPADQQQRLLNRVKTALAEAQTAQALLTATDGQVGVEATQVMTWHGLATECWQVARRWRLEKSTQ